MIFLKNIFKKYTTTMENPPLDPNPSCNSSDSFNQKKKKKEIMKRENDVSSKTLSYFFLFNLYPSLSSIYLLKNIFFIKKMYIKKFIYKEYYKIK